jgi:DNA polymerase III subunit beta
MFKIKAPVSILLNAVEFAASSTNKKHTLPILSNILIRATEDKLVLIGSDLETELECRLPVDKGIEIIEAGEITLPAHKLKSLLKGVDTDAVATLAKVDDNKSNADKYRLSFDKLRSRFTLMGLPATDYPSVEADQKDMKLFSVDSKAFLATLSTVNHAMGNQDVRYYLNGMQFQTQSDTLIMTATDGHRLAQNATTITPIKMDDAIDIIIPRYTIALFPAQLKQGEGELAIAVTQNHVMVKSAQAGMEKVIKSKLIDGRFPDWQRVIPQSEQQIVNLPRQALRGALNRAAILSNEKFRGIRFNFGTDTLSIEANNPENEVAQEELEVSSQAALEIGMNVTYLLQALDAYQGDEVKFHLGDETSSIVVRSEQQPALLNVIMPMRL